MAGLLQTALDRFVGSGSPPGLGDSNELPSPTYEQTGCTVVGMGCSGRAGQLVRRGYRRTRSFIVLPSQNGARWLLPVGTTRAALAGLEIYTPYAPAARVLKALFRLTVKTGWQGWPGHRVLVASREALPIEVLVGEVTGEHEPVFALSLGTPNRFRKLTLQVMRRDGETLGYIKLPLTEAAVERVRHEAEILKRLSNFAAIRPHIPRVLHAKDWESGYILFQSCGPSHPGPVEFNNLHEELLQKLRGPHEFQKPGPALVKEVAARWQKAEPLLDSRWRALGEAALVRASRELRGVMIPCGIMHGDFAPWNTRIGDGGLYAFDWESASWEAPTSWDIFHFKTQVAALLNKRNDALFSWDYRSGERASLLLYLLNSACQLFGEESPAHGIGLQYRRQLLAKQLGAQ